MFVTLVQAKPEEGPEANVEQAVQRVRDHLVPALHGLPGFKGFGVFEPEGAEGAGLLAFGIFDREENAAAAAAPVAASLPGPVAGGHAVFHEVAEPAEQEKERHRGLFAVVRTYHGLPGQTETMHSLVSKHTLPAIEGAAGFRGFYSFRDDAEPDRAISITLFDTREEAMGVHEAVLAIMREKLGEMAYEMPVAIMGETRVLVRG